MKSKLLASIWIAIGLAFLFKGIADLRDWRTDPSLSRLGLHWIDSGFPDGVVATLCGIGLALNRKYALLLALGSSVLFGLYYVTYLIFGGEGTLTPRLLLPVAFLALVVTTVVDVSKQLRQRRATSKQ